MLHRFRISAAILALAAPACDSAVAPRPHEPRDSQPRAMVVPADSVFATDTAVAGPNSPPDDFDGLLQHPAELPRVYLDTRYVAPTGRQIRVRAGDDLQAAIDGARAGDVLLLQPGAVFSGTFTLPKKAGAGPNAWVVIRSGAPDSQLPAEGQRITPSFASALPKIVGGAEGNPTVLQTAPGASFYRLIGVEVTLAPGVASLNSLVRLGDPSNDQTGAEPTDFVLDRTYIHGTPTANLVRCVLLSSARTAVIDSYLGDCHAQGQDAQAIVGWNGSGPYKIANNYLEGSGENVMFGGARPATPNVIPTDIEFRHNHVAKPASWKGGPWLVKNLFELKFARRVLVEGNLFEGNWRNGQTGYAINLKVGASMPWAATEDVTIRLNRIQNTGSGFSLLGADGPFAAVVPKLSRISIVDNLLDSVNVAGYEGDGSLVKVIGGTRDVTVAQNTLVSGGGSIQQALVMDAAPAAQQFTFRDNIIVRGAYGVKGSGAAEGSATLQRFAPGATFTNNVFIGSSSAPYPPTTYFVPTESALGFVSRSDRHLGASSSFRKRGTGGRDLGADIDAIEAATANVVVP